jgi:hypothetical protein
VANQATAIDAPLAQRQSHFGQLRGFARACLATHHHHLVVTHQRHNFVALGANRQVVWEIQAQIQNSTLSANSWGNKRLSLRIAKNTRRTAHVQRF